MSSCVHLGGNSKKHNEVIPHDYSFALGESHKTSPFCWDGGRSQTTRGAPSNVVTRSLVIDEMLKNVFYATSPSEPIPLLKFRNETNKFFRLELSINSPNVEVVSPILILRPLGTGLETRPVYIHPKEGFGRERVVEKYLLRMKVTSGDSEKQLTGKDVISQDAEFSVVTDSGSKSNALENNDGRPPYTSMIINPVGDDRGYCSHGITSNNQNVSRQTLRYNCPAGAYLSKLNFSQHTHAMPLLSSVCANEANTFTKYCLFWNPQRTVNRHGKVNRRRKRSIVLEEFSLSEEDFTSDAFSAEILDDCLEQLKLPKWNSIAAGDIGKSRGSNSSQLERGSGTARRSSYEAPLAKQPQSRGASLLWSGEYEWQSIGNKGLHDGSRLCYTPPKMRSPVEGTSSQDTMLIKDGPRKTVENMVDADGSESDSRHHVVQEEIYRQIILPVRSRYRGAPQLPKNSASRAPPAGGSTDANCGHCLPVNEVSCNTNRPGMEGDTHILKQETWPGKGLVLR